jgi:hypothetical protein
MEVTIGFQKSGGVGGVAQEESVEMEQEWE